LLQSPAGANPIPAALRSIWPALVAGPAALLLYALTLAPGLTWAHHGSDGGDFLAAALVGGVPHPSGYPTYEVLLRTLTTLFPGEPARWGNWLSAAAPRSASACLLFWCTGCYPGRPGAAL